MNGPVPQFMDQTTPTVGNEQLAPDSEARAANPIRRFFKLLGPGLITGAADDDPSGIGTYSQAVLAALALTILTAANGVGNSSADWHSHRDGVGRCVARILT
jgi:hypothetical protein